MTGTSHSRFGISLGNRRSILCKSNFNNIYSFRGLIKGNTKQKRVIVVKKKESTKPHNNYTLLLNF